MAQQDAVDILMMLKAGGTAIDAESQSVVSTSDTGWTDDFLAGKYFEVQDFDFGIDVVDQDTSGGKPDAKEDASKAKAKSGRFSKWIQGHTVATAQGKSGMLYPVEMTPFSFSRQLDCASPLIFKNCFKTIPFDSGALVMRKTGGLRGTSNIAAMPFLRIDFKPVLFIAIDWDGGEIVKEKCKFVCREVKAKYRSQKSDGSPNKLFYTTPLDLQKSTGGGGC